MGAVLQIAMPACLNCGGGADKEDAPRAVSDLVTFIIRGTINHGDPKNIDIEFPGPVDGEDCPYTEFQDAEATKELAANLLKALTKATQHYAKSTALEEALTERKDCIGFSSKEEVVQLCRGKETTISPLLFVVKLPDNKKEPIREKWEEAILKDAEYQTLWKRFLDDFPGLPGKPWSWVERDLFDYLKVTTASVEAKERRNHSSEKYPVLSWYGEQP